MKLLKRGLIVTALPLIAIAIILLLNFTAPNPTGRRYSSESPVTTGQGNSQEIGVSAERILANDLGVPRNDLADQRQCFCTQQYYRGMNVSECRSCIVQAELESRTYRRPDFISPTFIAESKNVQNMLYSQQDRADQIGDYAISARALGRPMYLYIRVNTRLDPEFYQLVESTGGAVVPYFTVEGWTDPVDNAAKFALAIGVAFLLLGIVLPSRIRMPSFGVSRPTPSRSPKPKNDPLSKAMRSTEDMEDFAKRTEENKRFTIDVEDSWGDK